jgi:hypothetical protein
MRKKIIFFSYKLPAGTLSLFDADPDPTFHPDTDPDPSFQIKARTLDKVLK